MANAAVEAGKMIEVELTGLPTNEAARKTLIRLFRKDPRAQRHSRQQQTKRPSWQEWRRGNATWHHQMKTIPPVTLQKGERYRFRATLDALRDLESVARFVKVKTS